ncbi:MAG: hypothetical protein K0Q49_817 [Haloplasmataceae bacterium]|nr:hypothetical protein [Haloplasmataceae bacterium]
MLDNSVFYIKTIFIIGVSFLTIGYLLTSSDNIIYETELNSFILFLNDNNTNNNIITYVAELLLKGLFQVDLSDLSSFYKNINPLY